MKITLLCSDEAHPVNSHLIRWMEDASYQHDIVLVRKKKDFPGGDILFLISCSEILSAKDRAVYGATLVLHASDLPLGRGWSPHIWQIIEGSQEITVSLLDAQDKVDSGRIWHQLKFSVPKHALWNEINESLFDAEIELINFAVKNFNSITPRDQNPDVEPTYYRLRTPQDSEIDSELSIANQFDKIRVCDPTRFPAFFELHGYRYKISVEKINDKTN